MFIIKKIWSNDITELLSKHASLDSSLVTKASSIVYKVRPELIEYIENNTSQIKQLYSRWQDKQVYFLTYNDEEFQQYQVFQDNILRVRNMDHINDIRKYDLSYVIENNSNHCIVAAPNGGHFITPSGKHVKSFIRIADAINSFSSLDRISYWLQPYLTDGCSGIIVDTPSLLSLVLHALLRTNKNIPFICLKESVRTNPDSAESVLRKFANRVDYAGSLLHIISITESGDTERLTKEKILASGITNPVSSISVFCFRNSPACIEAFCRLDQDFQWYASAKDCVYCGSETDRKKYIIDSNTLHPKPSPEKNISLKVKHIKNWSSLGARGVQEFYREYGRDSGVFRNHYTDKNDGHNSRHHAYYISVQSLLKNVRFCQEITDKLQEIYKERGFPEVIIHPPHDVAREIARIAKKNYPVVIIEHPSLENIDESTLADIKSSKHILIIDDVVITGNRLLNYLRNIRGLCDGNDCLLQNLSFFPIIIRPERKSLSTELKRSLSMHDWNNHLNTLYEFLVPNWNYKECPWCREHSLLIKNVSDPLDLDEWYQNRISVLNDVPGSGIIENPLMLSPGVGRVSMASSSPIVDSGYPEHTVLFVVASGLQSLRQDAIEPLGNDFFYTNVFNHTSLTQFSESMLQAALLRCSKIDEWASDFYESLGEKGICATFSNSDKYIYAEILLMLLHVGVEMNDVLYEEFQVYLNNDDAFSQLVQSLSTLAQQ